MAKIVGFFKECGAELRKVTWPTRAEVVSSVKVVLISTIIVAVILGGIDMLLGGAMTLVF